MQPKVSERKNYVAFRRASPRNPRGVGFFRGIRVFSEPQNPGFPLENGASRLRREAPSALRAEGASRLHTNNNSAMHSNILYYSPFLTISYQSPQGLSTFTHFWEEMLRPQLPSRLHTDNSTRLNGGASRRLARPSGCAPFETALCHAGKIREDVIPDLE